MGNRHQFADGGAESEPGSGHQWHGAPVVAPWEQRTWSAKISNPMPLPLDFSGTVEGDKLSGSVKAGVFGSFPFTGNRIA